MTLISTIQQELRQAVDTVTKNASSLVACVEQGQLPDTYTNDVQQINQATQKLYAFVERLDTPLSDKESAEAESFASTLRHDMRTPVNAIRGYSEIIAEETQDASESQEFLTSIINATDIILTNITKITPVAWKE
ncbi:MAG: hypothetical protein LBD15_02110 [Holosporales bacterium]|jgi:signal transduction histidine kinase|nr:hypothetical protein [Holosporales bacterium]